MSMSELSARTGEAATGQGARNVSARRAGVIVAVALAATGIFFVSQSWQLSFGDFGVPGPGVFPFVLGITLTILAIAIVAEELRRADGGATVEFGHRDVIVVFSALLVLSALFETAGAYATLGLMTAVLLRMLARVSLVTAVLSAAVGMALVWVVFKILLGVQLPAGPF